MQKIFVLLLAALCTGTAAIAQNSFTLIIKDKITKEPLPNVNITINKTGATTNNKGFVILKNIPNGLQAIAISHTGYQSITDSYSLPLIRTDTIEIYLEMDGEELNEVIVQSTRTSRTIKNTPTRVETIDGEELDEKNNMRPANVSMLLHESTGLQVQQTSATSGNASIRVQGLDGRYTQLLKDGYPNFGNFASGLSILEIPPLDLKQVEVIKGPASTLYGGGAIAGVVNFISKVPKEMLEADFIVNQSNIGQTNIGGYLSQKKGRWGYSFLGLVNLQKAYDVDKDDFSEIPNSDNFTINPKLFYDVSPSVTIMLGNSYTKGDNTGGDMEAIKNKPSAYHTYFEKNHTVRNTTTLEVEKKFTNKSSIKLKQSLGVFNRKISIPEYRFSGVNTNTFTDVSYVFFKQNHTIIAGLNFMYDNFVQKDTTVQNTTPSGVNNHNAKSTSSSAYFQDTWDVGDKIKIETGLRIDHVNYKNNYYNQNQTFVLPRVSALFRITDKITSRIGGGLGYKIPSIFTEQAESMQYQNILPLTNVTAEKSIGGTADINYKTNLFSDFSFALNQMFFYTSIKKPLVLQQSVSGVYYFANAAKPIVSKGFETNLKFIYKEDLKLFVGYTFTYARATYLSNNQFLPLLPKNKLNITLMYEKENNFKLGLEGYRTGQQYIYDGSLMPAFWEFGFMAQKTFGKVSVFVNFENFTDQRQSKYKTVVNPPHNNPSFDAIWNHTEGFVINGGIKLKL